jgi:hypothetical protein
MHSEVLPGICESFPKEIGGTDCAHISQKSMLCVERSVDDDGHAVQEEEWNRDVYMVIECSSSYLIGSALRTSGNI